MLKNKVVNRIGKIMVTAVVSAICLSGCASSGGEEYRQLDMNEAVEMMENEKDYIILDVRTEQEFEEQHIPNAINVPNETIGTKEIPELPDKEQLIMKSKQTGFGEACKDRVQQYSRVWWDERLAGRDGVREI